MARHPGTVGPAGLTLLTVAIAGVALLVWRANTPRAAPPSTLARIQATGRVQIGYANESPYGYFDTHNGRITGEAPEIAKIILRRMGATTIEPVVTEFGSLIPGLKAGRFDLIAAGMFITPERAEVISFSNPTYGTGEAFLVAAGNPLQLHSFKDVAAHDSARMGVLGGSVEHGYAKDFGVPGDRIIVFPDYPTAVAGLQTGRVDAVAATVPTVKDLLRKADDEHIERAQPFVDPTINGKTVKSYGAFGFRKDDKAFRKAFNRHLADFIGTPQHLKLVRPFGFSKKFLPGDVTAKDVIQRQ